MRLLTRATMAAAIAFTFLSASCSTDSNDVGQQGGACYPNDTCDEGLVCVADECVADTAFPGLDAGLDTSSGGGDAAAGDDTGGPLDDGAGDDAVDPAADTVDGVQEVMQDTDEPPVTGAFGDPCEAGIDCFSGFCLEHMGGTVCSKTCDEDCPTGWSCEEVSETGSDPAFICVSSFEHLCRPCIGGGDCSSVTSEAACVAYGDDGAFCGAACSTDDECPEGFSCQEVDSSRGGASSQCVRDAGLCECSPLAVELGLATECSITNEHGTCTALRICSEDGLAACGAATPAAEVCNGVDDDCDGDTDEEDPCEDGDPCTAVACLGVEGCAVDPLVGVACDDGDGTTADDVCQQDGTCAGTPIECPTSQCVLQSAPDEDGQCQYTYKVAGAVCDDGDVSTADDVCTIEGLCEGTPLVCEPTQCEISSVPNGVDCTVQYWANGHECDDGDDDTKNDGCDGAGACVGEAYVCELGPCDAASVPDGVGCAVTPNPEGAACDDDDLTTRFDACDGAETCAGEPIVCPDGECVATSAPNGEDCDVVYVGAGAGCDDGDPATQIDVCDGAGGCAGTPYSCEAGPCDASSTPDGDGCTVLPKAAGVPCDDEDPATGADTCDGAGTCVGTPIECVPGPCDLTATADGEGCVYVPTPAGVACDDDDPTTQIDICDGSGGCAGTPYTCEPEQCQASAAPNGVDCDSLPKAAGLPCDDGDLGTHTDACDGSGACVGTPIVCVPGICELDATANGSGCDIQYAPLAAACDDEDITTMADGCDGAGTCAGSPIVCPGINDCTANWTPNGVDCDPTYMPADVACDDLDPTTADDVCDGAGGCAGVSFECPEVTDCTTAWTANGVDCDPTYAAADAACDDGDATTANDICDGAGSCAGEVIECPDTTQCIADWTPNGTDCDPVYVGDGVPCNDGDSATANDDCDGVGNCGGDTIGCPLTTQCIPSFTTNGVDCDPVYAEPDAPCNDGDITTGGDVCDGAGSCAGTPIECPVTTDCTVDWTPNGVDCDPTYADPGAACDDEDAGTGPDVCDGSGGCAGPAIDCPATDECTTGWTPNGTDCDPSYAVVGEPCDDGDNETKVDVCDGSGGCAGEEYTCPSGTDCTPSYTKDGDGCVPNHSTASCDDGSVTTFPDTCDGSGTCVGTPYDCPGTSTCTPTYSHDGDGTCTASYASSGVGCDDGNSGTIDDQCDGSGGCSGTPTVCGDGNKQGNESCDDGNSNTESGSISISNNSVNENSSKGTTVGNLSTTLGGSGYYLCSGGGSQDNGSFTISGSQLRTDQVFVHGIKSSYSVRVCVDTSACNGSCTGNVTIGNSLSISINDQGNGWARAHTEIESCFPSYSGAEVEGHNADLPVCDGSQRGKAYCLGGSDGSASGCQGCESNLVCCLDGSEEALVRCRGWKQYHTQIESCFPNYSGPTVNNFNVSFGSFGDCHNGNQGQLYCRGGQDGSPSKCQSCENNLWICQQ